MMYERHLLVTGGLPFTELKAHSLIDARARAANDFPDFLKADPRRSAWNSNQARTLTDCWSLNICAKNVSALCAWTQVRSILFAG